jgi:hypothetical protein
MGSAGERHKRDGSGNKGVLGVLESIFRTDRVDNATRLRSSALRASPRPSKRHPCLRIAEASRYVHPHKWHSLVSSTRYAMPSIEAKLLSDFLVAPASLRDFMTLRQFTDIFPKGHRANPAVKDLYRELYTLRERDIEAVRQDIALEVKRSKGLRRDYARERRQVDEANVAGLDPVALQMEEEVSQNLMCIDRALTLASFRVPVARNRTRSRPSMPVLKTPATP